MVRGLTVTGFRMLVRHFCKREPGIGLFNVRADRIGHHACMLVRSQGDDVCKRRSIARQS